MGFSKKFKALKKYLSKTRRNKNKKKGGAGFGEVDLRGPPYDVGNNSLGTYYPYNLYKTMPAGYQEGENYPYTGGKRRHKSKSKSKKTRKHKPSKKSAFLPNEFVLWGKQAMSNSRNAYNALNAIPSIYVQPH